MIKSIFYLTSTQMIYKDILATVGNTPVIKIQNLAPEGIDIYVKAEYFNPASSVKGSLGIKYNKCC